MATLTVQNITLNTSLTPSYALAAGGGDDFINNGRSFLHVKNGSGAPLVVTIASLPNCSQGFDHDINVTVPATSEEMVGPFSTSRFSDSDGKATITYDGVTSLTIAVIALGV